MNYPIPIVKCGISSLSLRHLILIWLVFLTGIRPLTLIGEASDSKDITNLSLEDLTKVEITVASRRSEGISDAPGIVEVITAEEIEKFGAINLTDALNRVTSIQGIGSHFFPHFISMRGQTVRHSNNDVLFLIDGRPFRTSWNGGTPYPLLLGFPLEMIDRIEIIRGPGAILYGSGAFTGVINIVTKSTTPSGIKATYGELDTRGVEGGITQIYKDIDIVAGGKWLAANGWEFDATGERGVTDQVDMSEDNIGIVTSARYHGLSISGVYTEADLEYLGRGARWPSSPHKSGHLLLDLGYRHDFNNELELDNHITFNKFDLNPGNSFHRNSRDVLLESTFSGRISQNTNFLFGGTYEFLDGRVNGTGDETYSSRRYGLYTQTDYSPVENLKFVIGLQWNRARGVSSRASPRFGMIYHFAENFGTKLSYGEAFRTPAATERFIQTRLLVGNPNLDPEIIKTSEAQLFYSTRKHAVSLTYFNSQIEQLVTRTPTIGSTQFMFINGGEIESQGLELEGSATVINGLRFVSSLTWQDNQDSAGNDDATLAPTWMAKLGIDYENRSGLSIGIFDSYFDAPLAIRDLNPGVLEVNSSPKGYHLVTVNMTMDITRFLNNQGRTVSFSLFIDNLLNEDIDYPEINRRNINSIPIHSGRTFYGSLKVRF